MACARMTRGREEFGARCAQHGRDGTGQEYGYKREFCPEHRERRILRKVWANAEQAGHEQSAAYVQTKHLQWTQKLALQEGVLAQ